MSSRSSSRSRGRGGNYRARDVPPAPLLCYHCDGEGHIARNCPNKPPQLCFNCGKPGHVKRDCPGGERYERGTRSQHRAAVGPQPGKGGAALLVEVTGLQPDKNAGQRSPQRANRPPQRDRHPQQVNVPRPLPPPAKPTATDLKHTKFIDTHCHIEYVFERFKHEGSFAEFMAKHDYPENYEGCITTFCDPTAFSPSFGIWQSVLSEQNIWGTFGTHPHNAKYYHSSSLEEKMLICLAHPKCVAFGEIGLDYSDHSPSEPDVQKRILARQLQLAVDLKKPIVLHCRNAEEDLLSLLTSNVPHTWHLHLHCFTGSPEMAKVFLDTFPNLYIGICGNVTYESTTVQAVAATVPLERMLLETDAPYMVPRNIPKHLQKYKFNHPSLAFYTAKQIASIRRTSVEDVLTHVRENTRTVYGV